MVFVLIYYSLHLTVRFKLPAQQRPWGRQPRPLLESPWKDWQHKEHKRNYQFRYPPWLKWVMPQEGRFDVILWQVPGVTDGQLSPRDFSIEGFHSQRLFCSNFHQTASPPEEKAFCHPDHFLSDDSSLVLFLITPLYILPIIQTISQPDQKSQHLLNPHSLSKFQCGAMLGTSN